MQKMEAQQLFLQNKIDEICIRDVPEAILEILLLYTVLNIVSYNTYMVETRYNSNKMPSTAER